MTLNQKEVRKIVPAIFVYQKLLQLIGKKRFYAEIQYIENSLKTDYQMNSVALNWQGLQAIFKLLATITRMVFRNIFWTEQWFLLVNADYKSLGPGDKYRSIIPTLDRFWADPHIIHKDGVNYIFVEEYFYNKRKGRIAVIEFDQTGNPKGSIPVLEKEYHLSFPSMFEFSGNYYMVPESSENKTIEIYECSHFPDQWRFVMNLMQDIYAVDTTLFFYSGWWWMFTGIPDKSEALPKVRLHLFYSKTLLNNQWISHPQNPVVADSTRARPAGNLYMAGEKIYRPSQDTSKSYGGGILVNEITSLSESVYAEKGVQTINPKMDKNIKGAHTFSRNNSLTVMDAYRRVPRLLIRK